MSTEANLALVQQAYADFKAGNIPAVLGTLTDDVEWTTPGKAIPTAGKLHGKAEVAGFFQALAATWSFQAFEPRHFVASGDMVVCLGHSEVTSLATGKSASADWAMAFRFRDGKVAMFQEYVDTEAAVEALSVRAATA